MKLSSVVLCIINVWCQQCGVLQNGEDGEHSTVCIIQKTREGYQDIQSLLWHYDGKKGKKKARRKDLMPECTKTTIILRAPTKEVMKKEDVSEIKENGVV